MSKINPRHFVKSKPFIPENMPKRWKLIDPDGQPGLVQATFYDSKTELTVDSSIVTLEDGKDYINLAVLRRFGNLSLDDLWIVKNRFIGRDKIASIIMLDYPNWDDIPMNYAIILYELEQSDAAQEK